MIHRNFLSFENQGEEDPVQPQSNAFSTPYYQPDGKTPEMQFNIYAEDNKDASYSDGLSDKGIMATNIL